MRAYVALAAAAVLCFTGSAVAIQGSPLLVWTVLATCVLLHAAVLRRDWRSLAPFIVRTVVITGGVSIALIVAGGLLDGTLSQWLVRFMAAGLASLALFLPGVLDTALRLLARCGLPRDIATAGVLLRNNLPWTVRSFTTGVQLGRGLSRGRLRFAFLAAVAAAGRVPQTAAEYLTSSMVRDFSIDSTTRAAPVSLRVDCGLIVALAVVLVGLLLQEGGTQ